MEELWTEPIEVGLSHVKRVVVSILQALARGVVEAARIPETTKFGCETLTPVAIYTQENVRATNRSEK